MLGFFSTHQISANFYLEQFFVVPSWIELSNLSCNSIVFTQKELMHCSQCWLFIHSQVTFVRNQCTFRPLFYQFLDLFGACIMIGSALHPSQYTDCFIFYLAASDDLYYTNTAFQVHVQLITDSFSYSSVSMADDFL